MSRHSGVLGFALWVCTDSAAAQSSAVAERFGRVLLRRLPLKCCELRADFESVVVGVAERKARVDLVAVTPPDALPRQVPGVDEVVDDALRRSFRDSNALSDLA
jgi:hypothetical protein